MTPLSGRAEKAHLAGLKVDLLHDLKRSICHFDETARALQGLADQLPQDPADQLLLEMGTRWIESMTFCKQMADRWNKKCYELDDMCHCWARLETHCRDAGLVPPRALKDTAGSRSSPSSRSQSYNRATGGLLDRNIQDLPAEVHIELSRYLPAADIASLSFCNTKMRTIYDCFRWVKCAVVHDIDAFMKNHYFRSELLDCYHAHDAVPVKAFLDPARYSWFKSARVEHVIMGAHMTQKEHLNPKLFRATYDGAHYPRLSSFYFTPAFERVALASLLSTRFFVSLKEASSSGGHAPFLSLQMSEIEDRDLHVLLSRPDVHSLLTNLTLRDMSLHEEALPKSFALPALVSAALYHLNHHLYKFVLKALAGCEHLEDVSCYLDILRNRTTDDMTCHDVIHDLADLPVGIKSCSLEFVEVFPDIEWNQLGHDAVVSPHAPVELPSVTWIAEAYVSDHIMDRIVNRNVLLPNLSSCVYGFVFDNDYGDVFEFNKLADVLTRLCLNVHDNVSLPFAADFSSLRHLKMLKIRVKSKIDDDFQLKNVLYLVAKRLANFERMCHDELVDLFTFGIVQSQGGVSLFQEDERGDSVVGDSNICAKLVLDAAALYRDMGECWFRQEFQVIWFLESIFKQLETMNVQHLLLSTIDLFYPSPGLMYLLTGSNSLKQVLLQHPVDKPHFVLPDVPYMFTSSEFLLSNVLFDLKRKRKFATFKDSPITIRPEDISDPAFEGWV